MGLKRSVKNVIVIGALQFNGSVASTTIKNALGVSEQQNTAKAGTLTTRTDNTSGEITLSTGHGIATGNTVDLYWDGGYRYGVTVGTVSGNAVPISSGSGSNLPSATSAIRVCKVTTYDCRFDGDNVVQAALSSPARALFVFKNGSSSVTLVKEVKAGQVFCWFTESGESNPFAGEADVATVTISQYNTTQTTRDVCQVGIGLSA